jgi:CRP-like cAMP-binding protein
MIRAHARQFDFGESNIPMKKSSGKRANGSHGHENLFSSLKPEILEAFRASQITQSHPPAFTVFRAGEASKGIYLIHAGKIRLTMSGKGNEGLNSRIVRRGEILGLTPTVSGKPYEVTAETLCATQLSFIPKNIVTRCMDQDAEFAFRVLHLLCDDLGDAFEHVRTQVRPVRHNHRN